MSFLSDLFHGNFGNLGEDIAPQNVFKDFGSSAMNVLSNPIADVGIGLAALTGGLALAPELLGAGAADVAGTAAAEGGFGAASDAALGAGGGLGPGVAAGTVDIGTPIVTGAADAAGGLSDQTIADFLASPGAQAFGSVAQPTADVTMGAGGDLSPEAAMAAGAPASGAVGGATVAPTVAAPSFAQDLTGSELLAGTGVGGTSAGTGFAPAAAGGAGGGGNILSTIGNFMASPAGKGLSTVAGLGGLGYNMFQGYQQNQALKAEAATVKAQSDAIAAAGGAAINAAQPFITTGTNLIEGGPLPASLQASIDQVVASQKAQIIQGYAAKGMPTDPKMNSALAQDLNNVDQNMLALKANIGNQIIGTANSLLTSGTSATKIAAELPIMMQKLDIQLQAMTGNAIANFAAAMSGGTMKVAGAGTPQTVNVNTSGNPLLA